MADSSETKAEADADPIKLLTANLKAFLQCVSARELHRRISQFRGLNFRAMSYDEVHQAVLGVLEFDTPRGSMALVPTLSSCYVQGTRFYRIRAIPKDDLVLPPRSMSKVSDCWEPPKELVRIGRLNRDSEPLLYTSPVSPMVAIDELKVADGERCSVIVYEAVEDVNVTVIGGDHPATAALDEAGALKLEMIRGFLRDEFTRDVGRGTEYLYRISEIIAKDWFDLPPEMHDAWCYPSIADKGRWNVAFRPKDRRKLRLVGVQIARPCTLPDGRRLLEVGLVATEKTGTDDLAYFRMGSPEQCHLFPELAWSPGTESPSDGGASY